MKLVGQCPGGHLPDLAGQLNARGPTAGDGEGQPGVPIRAGRQGLGHLERAEQPSPDAHGVVEGFHARCPLGELFVPEVRLPHPDREDRTSWSSPKVVSSVGVTRRALTSMSLPPSGW